MYKLLLIEDDLDLANSICDFFESPLYQITHIPDGQDGYNHARTNPYDLIILDVMLPRKNGLVVASQLRTNHVETPILIISTRNLVDDIVNGFCFGIDGYITKPFNLREFKSRCLALLKRPSHTLIQEYKIADLRINMEDFKVSRNSRKIKLRKKEFYMLKFLFENSDKVVTKDQLIETLWPLNDSISNQNNLDVHISSLRSKIDKGHEVKLLHTIHGIGYTLSEKQNCARQDSNL